MPSVKAGDTVKIHYTGRLEDGTVFATTRDKEPMEFTVGTAEIIPGLQEAVIGMSVGETKTELIPPERAYGPYHEQMTATLDRKMAPPKLEIGVGVSLRVKHADGHESDVTVTELSETKMTVDGNHPLAGKTLLLEIDLLDIVSS